MKNSFSSILIFLVFLFVSTSWAFAGEATSVELQWSFKGKNFNWNSQFAKEDCDYYRNRPHPNTRDYSVYATDTVDDRYISELAEQFRHWMDELEMSDLERVNFVATFVQSLPYTTDSETTAHDEYPRYPLETLMDKGGDCEDTAILAATLLKELDYEVALIALADHVGVGVVCGHCSGEYFYAGETEYVYLETTGENWELGQIPPQFNSPNFRVYALVPQPVVEFEFSYTEVKSLKSQKAFEVTVLVKNSGSTAANNLKIITSFAASEEGQTYSEVVSDPLSLDPEDKLTSKATLYVPKNVETQIQVAVVGDNFTTEKIDSEKLTIQ